MHKRHIDRGPFRQNERLRRLALSLPTACAAILSGAEPAAAQDRAQLEEVVVTTRFREENLQEIPFSISAITAGQLEANGATSVIEVADWAPNVTIDQLGQGYGPTLAANIRGLGYGDFRPTSEPTVTFYVDDVVLSRPTGAIMDLLDLERVEVLRGPQGTLFGKNAIGGVVRMVSRKPGEGQGNGEVEVTTGTYGRLDVRGAFGTTLIADKLFSRVSFVSKERDGYLDNVDFRCQMLAQGTPELAGVGDGIVGWDTANGVPIMGEPFSPEDNNFAVPTRVSGRGVNNDCVVGRLGDQDTQAARAMLRFLPNDKFELNLATDITTQNDTSPYELTEINPNLPALAARYNEETALPTYGVPWDARFSAPDINTTYAGFSDAGRADGGIETPNVNNIDQWGASGTADFYLDDVDVKLIVAHRQFDALFGQDSDGSPLNMVQLLNDYEQEQDSVELRVSGTLFNGRTSWTAGYFGFESYDIISNIIEQFPCINTTSCIDRVDQVWVDNSAFFLNTQTDLTDRLALTIGLRNSDDDKEILQERYDRSGEYCCGFDDPSIVVAKSSRTDPMVSLSYQYNDGILIYGTYQEGFRGGGTTPRPTATTRIPFGPETLKNFEVGIKSDVFANRARINASVFDMTYEDIQQGAAGVDEIGQPAFVTINAGEASITGFEFEARATVGDHWVIDGTLGHLDYQITDLGAASPEALLAAGLNPNNAPDINDGPNRTPEYTASLNVGYFLTLENSSELSVRYGASWRDDAWWGPDGDTSDPTNLVPARTLANFRVTWLSPDQEWQASLFCTNCTNERTTSSRLNFYNFFGHRSVTYVRPEEWGLSIKKSF